MSSLINLKNVSKVYSLGDKPFFALSDINLEISRGEMTAIMGISGSGKSTLMHIMGCLDRISSGQYFFSNENVSDLPEEALADIRNKKIGFVFQSFFLLPRQTALQNVLLPLFYRNTPLAEAESMGMAMLEKVGMAQFARHQPNQLSGGQQQRVAIARALVGNPDVILADEPTGALDSKTGQDVMALLGELSEQDGRTIVIITHDNKISHHCKRVVMLEDGKIIF